jgi:hypothetical protein
MTTKLGRCIGVEVICEECGEPFIARQSRVKEGRSRFCSLPCYHVNLKKHKFSSCMGYENAKPHYDIVTNRWMVHWMDENFKQRSSTYPRWLWNMNYGEVPDGYKVEHSGDKTVLPELHELVLTTQSKLNQDIKDSGRGFKRHTEETKKKLSIIHKGKTLSSEHKEHIGDASRELWNSGKFDTVHVGTNNPRWRGGINNGYPNEYRHIRPFILERDKNMCQICGKTLSNYGKNLHVHHISGNRMDNTLENLILLCSTCHMHIHGVHDVPPVFLAFREKLEWNN